MLFVLVFIAIYVSEWEHIVMFITRAGTIALILNLTMMILSFYIAKFFVSGASSTKMHLIRVWTSEWNISSIRWNTNFW